MKKIQIAFDLIVLIIQFLFTGRFMLSNGIL